MLLSSYLLTSPEYSVILLTQISCSISTSLLLQLPQTQQEVSAWKSLREPYLAQLIRLYFEVDHVKKHFSLPLA